MELFGKVHQDKHLVELIIVAEAVVMLKILAAGNVCLITTYLNNKCTCLLFEFVNIFFFVICITNKIKMAYRTRKYASRRKARRMGGTRRRYCKKGGAVATAVKA